MIWKALATVRSRRVGAATVLGVGCLAFAAEAEAAAESPAVEGAAAEAEPASGAPARHASVFVDPLGFALFGPRLGAEAGAGHFSGALHARWFNAGLLSRSLFLAEGDSFGFSYGVGLRGRYYLTEGLEGLHFGVAAEYLHSRVEKPAALVATTSSYVVPYAEVGYRLSLGRVYADLSGGLGYAIQASSSVENLPGGSAAGAYAALDESSVYGTASLELGIFF